MSEEEKKAAADKAAADKAAKSKGKKVKVTFLKSPSAKYKLAYSEGQVAMVDSDLAKELIKEKYAKKGAAVAK